MNISSYISTLLQLHKCVIVPDFGAFVSNKKPATIANDGMTFQKPSVEVIFNPRIKNNDALLANFIVEVESVSYVEAMNSIRSYVEHANQKLNRGETLTIDQVGEIRFDQYGMFVFEENISNSLDFEMYGLGDFKFDPLYKKSADNNTAAPSMRPAVRALHKDFVFKAAATVALLITLSILPQQKSTMNRNLSHVLPLEIPMDNELSEVSVEDNVTILEAEQISEVAEAPAQEIEAPVEIVPQTQTKKYYIVVGSFRSETNIQALVHTLAQKGYAPEIWPMDNGMNRVVANGFSTKDEAILQCQIFSDETNFRSAWVIKK